MLRITVTVHPAGGSAPREVAAAVIAQRGQATDGRHRYAGLAITDGLDGDTLRAGIVEHERGDGLWALVATMLAALDRGTVDELVPVLREALARYLPAGLTAPTPQTPNLPLRPASQSSRPARRRCHDGRQPRPVHR